VNGTLDMETPDRFSVGAAGPVGQRVFMLHAAQGAVTLTVKVEKQQVAVLAGYLARIVRELGHTGKLPEDLDFDLDVEPSWVVGTIGVSYDEDVDRLVVVMEESGPPEDDEDEVGGPFPRGDDEEPDPGASGAVARVLVTKEQAAAFAIRATRLVEAGRPSCPLCGLPLDPSGHDCPRTNGHRPPVT
jgi:uncharacterized repeat protein (TIGR03847 family)